MRARTTLREPTTFEQVQQAHSEGARIVPITVSLPADLDTPLSLFLKVKTPKRLGFLLESVEKGETTGRFSFLGFGHHSDLLHPPLDADPVQWLSEQLPTETHRGPSDLPRFWGGAVGHLGWEAARQLEPAVGPRPERFGPPEGPQHAFLYCRRCLIFDHVAQLITAVVVLELPEDPGGELLSVYRAGREDLETLRQAIGTPVSYTPPTPPESFDPEETFLTPKERFLEQVEAAQGSIHRGEVFQLVLSQKVKRKTWLDAVGVYRALRMLNPSPYTFLLDFGDYQLVGSSPEMLVSLDGERAVVCPIAGTRKRTGDPELDRAAKAELLSDEKELAEHLMLVDLGRNDLGRVCRYGSVTVPRYGEVEMYSHVMHIVSKVEGRLDPEKTPFDLLRASFPAGTVSGAPKIRALQLIDELEDEPRDFYAGAVGYFGSWGTLDACIAIRTMLLKDGWVTFQAGAGIVADSKPEAEWDETLIKLEGLRQAVDLAEELFSGEQER